MAKKRAAKKAGNVTTPTAELVLALIERMTIDELMALAAAIAVPPRLLIVTGFDGKPATLNSKIAAAPLEVLHALIVTRMYEQPESELAKRRVENCKLVDKWHACATHWKEKWVARHPKKGNTAQQAIAMRKAGHKTATIAERLKVKEGTVKDIMTESGITPVKAKRERKKQQQRILDAFMARPGAVIIDRK